MPEMKDNGATQPVRRRLPDERKAIVHHFNVGGYEGYLTVGFYEDGTVGEIFITTAKEGSTVSGLMDCFATAVSLALQYGVSLKVLCDKFSHTRFEPSGWSGNPEIGYAKSFTDYIFRWLALKFLPPRFSSPNGRRRLRPRLRRPPTFRETDRARAGGCASMQRMRSHYDPQRIMLSLRELWEYKWVFVISGSGASAMCG